jgi:hypothetical protein
VARISTSIGGAKIAAGATAVIPMTVMAPLPALNDSGKAEAPFLELEQKLMEVDEQLLAALRDQDKAESAMFRWEKRNPRPEMREVTFDPTSADPNSDLKLHGTRPAEGGNKAAKLRAIREALRTAKWVWLATDCDRDGQLIAQEILEHYEYRDQVMRVLFIAQDSQTIRDAFGRAKPNAEYAFATGRQPQRLTSTVLLSASSVANPSIWAGVQHSRTGNLPTKTWSVANASNSILVHEYFVESLN